MARQATIKTAVVVVTAAAISNQTTTTASKLLMATTNSTLESFRQYNTTVASLSLPTTDGHHSHNSIAATAKEFCKQTSTLSHPNASTTNASTSNHNYIVSDGNGGDDEEQLYVKLSTFWYCFFAFITTVGLLVSLVSNMIIIYLFTGTPSLRRNPSNIIAVNLSLSDLLYCFQWPSVIYSSLSQSTWMLEIDFVCKTFGFITVTTASASVLTVLAMSVERAIVIKYSIYAKSRYTIRSAWFIVVLIWVVSIGSSLPPLFDKFNRFTLDPSKTSCTLDYLSSKTDFKLYMLCIYIVYWIVPATIITICYIFIILTFKRSSKNLRQVTSLDSTSSPASLARSELSLTASRSDRAHMTLENGASRIWPRSFSRDRLRDSIRLTNFLGNLRRSSTTRLAHASPTSVVGSNRWSLLVANKTRTMDVTKTSKSLDSSNRMQTIRGGQHRPLKRIASSNLERKLDRFVTNQSGSDQALERIELARITGSMQEKTDRFTVANHETRTLVVGCETSHDELLGEHRSSDDRQAASSNQAVPNERSTLKLEPLRRQCSRRLTPLDASQAGPPNEQHDSTSITGPVVDQHRPVFNRPSQAAVGSGNANFISSPPTSTFVSRVRGIKLAIVSRVMSQSSCTTTVDQPTATTTRRGSPAPSSQPPPSNRASCSKLNSTAPSAETTTCHFGNSSSQSSRARMQIRLAKMSFYLILLWLISWTPIASLTLINLIAKCHVRANALVVFLANTMTKLGPTFDVFIYGISHPRIKKKFVKIIKRLLMLKDDSNNGLDATNYSNATLHQRPFHLTQATLNADKLSARASRGFNLESLSKNKIAQDQQRR